MYSRHIPTDCEVSTLALEFPPSKCGGACRVLSGTQEWGCVGLNHFTRSLAGADVTDRVRVRLQQHIRGLTKQPEPGPLAIGCLLSSALDPCYSLNQNFVCHTPGTPLDLAQMCQSWLKGFRYYPACVPLNPHPWSLVSCTYSIG